MLSVLRSISAWASIIACYEAVQLKSFYEQLPTGSSRWNVMLSDVSTRNEFWGHPEWPERADMHINGDGNLGVFSLIWMDLNSDGAPDLFVRWHGGGILILQNDGQGNFELHKTTYCPLLRGGRSSQTSLVWSTDGVDDASIDPFAPDTASQCPPEWIDGHGAIAVDLDNDGMQEVFATVGGAQGTLQCSGPKPEDCVYSNTTLDERAGKSYYELLQTTGNAIYAIHEGKLYGGQRGANISGIEGLGERAHHVMAADFNLDGLVDLLVGDYIDKAFPVGTHPSRIWLQQRECGDHQRFCFSDADQLGYVDPANDTKYQKVLSSSSGHLLSIQVFNNNSHIGGFTHLLQRYDGLLSLQQWDGHQFKQTQAITFSSHEKACQILLGDFDGDGRLEALACHGFHLGSELALYQAVSDMFSDDSPKQLIASASSKRSIEPVAIADFDNDGHLDALAIESWKDTDDSPQARLRVLENNGRGQLSMATGRIISAGPPSWEEKSIGFNAVVADVDRDGRMDVAVSDAGTRVMLFKNESPRRPWICVAVEGTLSNRGAVGALILISQGDRIARRDVTVSSPSQDYGGVSCAGLWEDAPAEVVVCWPRVGNDGCEQFGRLANNATHVLKESS